MIINEMKTIGWQEDRSVSVKYDQAYFEKLKKYEYTETENKISDYRINLTMKYVRYDKKILDFGCGTGIFAKKHPYPEVVGFDLMYDKNDGNCMASFKQYDAICMWDVLEHIQEPDKLVNSIKPGTFLFLSLPIFDTLENVAGNKHCRPNEHYWYFTDNGIKDYLKGNGYELVEQGTGEINAGRDSIHTYVFKRNEVKICQITKI